MRLIRIVKSMDASPKEREHARIPDRPVRVRSPRPVPGALAHTTGFSSPADLDAGSSGAGAGKAGAFTVGDNLDPE
jgi:hypothetical protein